jgi:hypothetical protein
MLALVVMAALAAAEPAPPDTALWQSVLTNYVTADGRVRYAALQKDRGEMDRYLEALKTVSPDSHPQLFPSPAARLAYWMNAYNALVIGAFVDEYPSGNRRLANKIGQFNFFYRRKFTVGGKQRSLDDIESVSIRKASGDPRIHFAIVCASTSCPGVSRIAYTAENVDRELTRLAHLFINDSRHVEPAKPQLTLSMIFKWYEGDFGGRDRLIAFLDRYREGGKIESWGVKPRVRYREYDWSLNEAP